MNSLAQLQVGGGYWEAEAMWTQQHEADQEQKCQKRAATRDAYGVTNQQKMAAWRVLECIGTSKPRLVFKYEISDLFL